MGFIFVLLFVISLAHAWYSMKDFNTPKEVSHLIHTRKKEDQSFFSKIK